MFTFLFEYKNEAFLCGILTIMGTEFTEVPPIDY